MSDVVGSMEFLEIQCQDGEIWTEMLPSTWPLREVILQNVDPWDVCICYRARHRIFDASTTIGDFLAQTGNSCLTLEVVVCFFFFAFDFCQHFQSECDEKGGESSFSEREETNENIPGKWWNFFGLPRNLGDSRCAAFDDHQNEGICWFTGDVSNFFFFFCVCIFVF